MHGQQNVKICQNLLYKVSRFQRNADPWSAMGMYKEHYILTFHVKSLTTKNTEYVYMMIILKTDLDTRYTVFTRVIHALF